MSRELSEEVEESSMYDKDGLQSEDASSDGSKVEDEVDSDGSTDTDEDIDESVVEEMQKLEESFVGISRKYRLINRIGEGRQCLILSWLF